MRWPVALTAALGLAAAAATPAAAQMDLVSSETWHGVLDLRLAGANAEVPFAEGAFGKLRYGGDDGDWRANLEIAEAALEWRPRLGWDLTGVVDVIAQPYQEEHPVDLDQAYISYRPTPRSATRFTARAGMFYPELSLEHDAPLWGLSGLITPSAIGAWAGEELKVIGVEGQVTRDFANGGRLGLTLGLYGGGDTAGTLITYRGWALHDQHSTAFGEFELPPLGPFSQFVQPGETYSIREIDHRLGFYARLEWRPVGPLELVLFHYDNRGDQVGVTMTGQWAWDTRFTAVGLRWTPDADTQILAQALIGRTRDGFPTPRGLFGDVTFRAAYASVSRTYGRSTLTGRVDAFDTVDHTTQDTYPNAEDGWALTAAWRYALTQRVDLRVEAVHVRSDRPARAYAGLPAEQGQTQLQSSLRYTF